MATWTDQTQSAAFTPTSTNKSSTGTFTQSTHSGNNGEYGFALYGTALYGFSFSTFTLINKN